MFGSWTSKTPQTIHNLINWIWKAFLVFAHSTLSLEIYLMENYLPFKFMKIDEKFHWKIFEDGKAFFVEIHYPKNWNFQFLFPFFFQATARENLLHHKTFDNFFFYFIFSSSRVGKWGSLVSRVPKRSGFKVKINIYKNRKFCGNFKVK